MLPARHTSSTVRLLALQRTAALGPGCPGGERGRLTAPPTTGRSRNCSSPATCRAFPPSRLGEQPAPLATQWGCPGRPHSALQGQPAGGGSAVGPLPAAGRRRPRKPLPAQPCWPPASAATPPRAGRGRGSARGTLSGGCLPPAGRTV